MVKVKKNKAPKQKPVSAPFKRKGRYGTAGSVQKQTVNQHVKVNLYKPTRVPKCFKERQAPHNGTPNIRALPSFSFNSTVQQPASVLYGERFGNARTVQVSPFERLLAQEATDDNRALEVAQLKNSLESTRLKKIQAEPILAPAKRGESEDDRFMDRAAASTDDNREPFRVSSVDEQGTLGASFRSRPSNSEFVRQARLKNLTTPEHVSSLKLPPNTIRDTLRQAEAEAEGRELFSSPPLTTDRPPREQYFVRDPEATTLRGEMYEEPAEERELELVEPEIPSRLASYGADPLGEVVPTRGEGEADATLQNISPIDFGDGETLEMRRGRGRPIQFVDTPHRLNRERVRAHRQRAKSTEK